MKHLAVLLAAAALSSSCGGAPPQYKFTYAEKRARLPNGIRLVVIPDKTTSLVKTDLRYEVGSNEDPPGKAGLAHLVEHMMFQHHPLGADKPPTFQLLEQFGVVDLNAYTIYDKTHYYLVAPKEKLDGLLRLEAFRMNAGCQSIPEEQFLRERDVVRNEIRGGFNTAIGLIFEMMSADVYPAGHPYSHTTGGNDTQLASIQLKDVCDFMQKYYVPSRATLVVTGNVDPDEVGRMVNFAFGKIPDRPAAPRVAVAPIQLKYRKVVHELAQAEHPYVFVFWRMPPRTSKDYTKVQALFTLWQKIAKQVDDWDFALSVQPLFLGGELAPVFGVALELPPGGDVDSALDYVWKATKHAHWGLNAMDFDFKTRNFIKAHQVENLEPLAVRGDFVADEIQFSDGTVNFDGKELFGLKELREIDKLTSDGWGDFVKNTLDRSKAVVVVFKPSKSGARGDTRANVSYSAKTDQHQDPIVDPAEAKRPLPVPAANSILDKAERYTLGNGMRVILLHTDGLPLIHAQIVFKAGAAQESPSSAGLADVAATYLRPTAGEEAAAASMVADEEHHPFTDFADFSAMTDDDTTTFIGRGINIYAEPIIKGLERYIKIGTYDQDSLEKWQKRTKEELKATPEERRQIAFQQELAAALFGPKHPYTTNGTPTEQSIGHIGYDAAMAYKREHYSAKNATLIVVGNFADIKEVKDLISDNFGDWNGGHEDRPLPATQVARTGPEIVGIVSDYRPQVEVALAYPAPAGRDGQHAARMVLATMLSEKMNELRTELGSTYGIYGHITNNLGPNAYRMDSRGGYGTIDEAKAGVSIKAMREKIDSLRKGENFDKVFAVARRRVLQDLLVSGSETFELADRLARIAGFGLGPDYYDTLARYVAAVSEAQVKALIATELDPKKEVLVLMNDRKTLEKTFKEAGITSVRYVEPK